MVISPPPVGRSSLCSTNASFCARLCSEQSAFSTVAVEQFSVEALGFGQFDTTEGRLALAIARYHSKHENWQRAEAFANLGLKYGYLRWLAA